MRALIVASHQPGEDMIVMQYVLALPSDYDMGIIRERVATRGPNFDDLPGLGLKAFMIREKGRFGARGNQYAPVYCWPAVEQMWGFIAGAGFEGIVESFGRPAIDTWLGLAFARDAHGEDLAAMQSVVREEEPVTPVTNLRALREHELAESRRIVDDTPGLIARATGLNPQTWSLVRFEYWALPQAALPKDAYSYEVLHVSAPDLHALPDVGATAPIPTRD
jgi:Domain of unknown function (DUF4865)